MAIINPMPVLRADYCADLASKPHLHEGKAAKFDSEGKLALATSSADVLGVFSDPDGENIATCGCPTSASLVLASFGGIIEVQLGAISAALPVGTPLFVDADGTFTDAAPGSESEETNAPASAPVALLLEPVTSTVPGQLVRAIFKH